MPGPGAPQTGGLCAPSESIILLFVFSSGLMICEEKTAAQFLGLGFLLELFCLVLNDVQPQIPTNCKGKHIITTTIGEKE